MQGTFHVSWCRNASRDRLLPLNFRQVFVTSWTNVWKFSLHGLFISWRQFATRCRHSCQCRPECNSASEMDVARWMVFRCWFHPFEMQRVVCLVVLCILCSSPVWNVCAFPRCKEEWNEMLLMNLRALSFTTGDVKNQCGKNIRHLDPYTSLNMKTFWIAPSHVYMSGWRDWRMKWMLN